MDRIVIVGSSGSGKTAVARRLSNALDLPRLELDSLFHQEGWDQLPDEEFRTEVAAWIRPRRWLVDGNYTSHGMTEVLWPEADTFIWLDMSKQVVMRRVISRTLRRVITREELWNGVREPWTNLYSTDPEKNIIVWAWTRYDHTKERYRGFLQDGTWDHATVHRLRSPDEVEFFLSSVEEETTAHHN